MSPVEVELWGKERSDEDLSRNVSNVLRGNEESSFVRT